MAIDLPAPIAAYFAARNTFDIEAILAPFDENAVVKDEDREHHGRVAIRAWIEQTTRQYHATVEPQGVKDANGTTVVSGLVAGDFAGSPVLLDHAFTLSGGSTIARLEIG
jgi:hypothetical protein